MLKIGLSFYCAASMLDGEAEAVVELPVGRYSSRRAEEGRVLMMRCVTFVTVCGEGKGRGVQIGPGDWREGGD
jgi:hypothetical protein